MTIYDGRESFYQWDLNQKITSNTFAVGDKIHFFNMRQSNALVVKAYELDGKVVADVPNILLQNALALKVWRYEYGANSAQTIEEQTFNVEQRAQPYDYFYTETELYELRKEVMRSVEVADIAEEARELAENERKVAELLREDNEASRLRVESDRVEAEIARASAETLRANAESNRATAETNRVSAEQSRVATETARQTAEQARQSAETLRQTTFEQSYNNVANALKGSESGEVVRVDDVSSIEHTVKTKIGGKNKISLFNAPNINSTYRSWLVNPNGKTFTLSITDNDSSVDIEGMYLGFTGNGENGTDGIIWLVDHGDIRRKSYTCSDLAYISIYGNSRDETANALSKRFNIQLEEGDTATEYEPHIDPTTVMVTRCRKNLLNVRKSYSEVVSGVTFSFDENGKCTINGTNEKDEWIYSYAKLNDTAVVIPKGTTVTLSGVTCPNSTYAIRIFANKTIGNTLGGLQGDYYNPTTITLVEDIVIKQVLIRVAPNATISNAVITPMLEIGSVANQYEPYNETFYQPSADGTVNIASVSPTMTLLTDTEGVTIEAEYNRDANLVVADLQSQIDSLKALVEGLKE